jgi:hypothetical protein
VERHLAAFETAHFAVARNRLGTLGATAGKFASAGTHTLAQAAFFMLLALGWAQAA